MGLYIKGAEMPKTCGDCRFLVGYGKFPCYCAVGDFPIKPSEADMRDGICPLVEVKTPHGRLVDFGNIKYKGYTEAEIINMFPTVIEAED